MRNAKVRALTRFSTAAMAGAMLISPPSALARFGDAMLHTGSSGHDVRVLQSWLDRSQGGRR